MKLTGWKLYKQTTDYCPPHKMIDGKSKGITSVTDFFRH